MVLVVVVVLVLVWLSVVAAALVDLSRREVRHLPKWAWALIIAFVSFPAGVIAYFVVGRVPSEPGGVPLEPGGGRAPHGGPAALRGPPGPPGVAKPQHGPPVLTTAGLGKTYGETVALEDVDLAVPRGATYGLIGPNGAGKTTLLSVIAGLRRPSSGTFQLGVPRRSLGVLVDTPQFEPWLTAREVVDLARHLTAPELPAERTDETLAGVGLAEAAGRRVGGFSRGMLQRLGLASCLVGDPEVLLLDEPSSALDPSGRREVLDLIGRLAYTKTVVLSTHILGDVQQVCDVVGVIDRGRLRFQGPIHELLSRTSTAYSLHVRSATDGLREVLRRRAWVTEVVEQAPGHLRLVVSDATRAEREVPQVLAEAGAQLVSFHPATDLETAFLELTS